METLQVNAVVSVCCLMKCVFNVKREGSQAVRIPLRVPFAGANTKEVERFIGRKDFALKKSMVLRGI